MSRKLIRFMSAGISIFMAASVLAGCGAKNEAQNKTDAATTSAVTTEKVTETQAYPISGSPKLTYWLELNPNLTPIVKNMADTPFAVELEKKTGVKVEYLHPAAGQTKEAFSLLVASGDLPDLIEYNWLTGFPGGPEQAIANNVILKLNDVYEKYAPNLSKYLKENPEVDKLTRTDAGSYYVFPLIRGDESLLVSYGLVMRGDWLNELGFESPTTIDEWYAILKAFKEKKNATAPFSYYSTAGTALPLEPFRQGILTGAFGIKRDYFQENGKVKFGPMEPGYKDFLATMAKWYNEGLLDKNFSTNDLKAIDNNVLNNLTGALPTLPGSGMGKYIPALQQKDPNATLVPVAFPVLKKGDVQKISTRQDYYTGSASVAISGTCKNVEAAARFLDYAYSEEGNLFYNFGIDGKSYTMVNNSPVMTDEVMNNPDKLPIGQAWSKYARGNTGGPFVQRKEYIQQYYQLQTQKDALVIWNQTEAAKYKMPPVSPTADESSRFAKIMNDVNTYVDEFSLKVIMGNETVENFDKYLEQLNKLNVNEAVAINQAALDRFNKR